MGVLLLGGDGDEAAEETASVTPPGAEIDGAAPTDANSDERAEDRGDGKRSKQAPGAGGRGSDAKAAEGRSPFVGTPVGRVPKGAGPDANRQAVVRTLRVFLKSISRGKGAQACAQLSSGGERAMRRKIAEIAPETASAPCAASVVLYQGGYGKPIRDPKITGVSVSGNSAKATGPLRQPATLVKSGRLWQISRYGDDY